MALSSRVRHGRHSRLKNGVASLAYVPATHDLSAHKTWMPGLKPGMTAIVVTSAAALQILLN
jgi:hypothetical protein